MESLLPSLYSAQLLTAAFLAVLFLQSGLDKVFDWQGNLSWLKGHFSKSPLAGMVPFMLFTVTVVEIAAGAVSAAGLVFLLLNPQNTALALLGAQLSALSLLMLFFGQRMAKDYPGAATLAGYFILATGAILIFGYAG